jgi:hypothetical protein
MLCQFFRAKWMDRKEGREQAGLLDVSACHKIAIKQI